METEKIGVEGRSGSETGRHLHIEIPTSEHWPNPLRGARPNAKTTGPHMHWCAVCGIGLGGDA